MFSRRQTLQARENCSLQPSEGDTMEEFRVETQKALWQAFDSLDTAKTGLVHVSQLKVITSNVGMKMGVEKGEELLNKDGVTSMDFNTYFAIVKSELIEKVEQSEGPGKKSISERLNSIIKTCWTFCNFERLHKSKWLSFDHCLVLWRLFNFLSETDDSGEPEIPVQLHVEEASMLLKHFVDLTGQKNKEQIIKASLSEIAGDGLCFADFLNVFEKDCVTNLSKSDITHGLNHLQDTYLLNILGKAMLWKRGFKVKNWKERWCVMTPKELKYYVSSNEKVMKGVIEFDADCTVEILPDRAGHKSNRFVLHTKKKPYEMSAPDMRIKNEWVSGLGMAFEHVGKDANIQKESARVRCKARIERRRQLAEEERKRLEDAEFLKQQQGELDEERRRRLEDEELLRKRLAELEEERRLREEAEARALEEQALKEAEMQKLRELEEIKRELERLLEEERQAKKDEEIVRSLQAKILEEEFQRREELEQLKKQQDDMLKAEREQKAMLESDRQEQERALREAQLRLEELDRQRAMADQKMQEATEKLQKAEKDRQKMEDKVKLWKTPVGLARPILPTANPFVTHRGEGAFCAKDFASRGKLKSEPAPATKYDLEEDETETSEHSEIKDQSKLEIGKETETKAALVEAETENSKNSEVKDQGKPEIDKETDMKADMEDTDSDNSENSEIKGQSKPELEMDEEKSDKGYGNRKNETGESDGDSVVIHDSLNQETVEDIIETDPKANLEGIISDADSSLEAPGSCEAGEFAEGTTQLQDGVLAENTSAVGNDSENGSKSEAKSEDSIEIPQDSGVKAETNPEINNDRNDQDGNTTDDVFENQVEKNESDASKQSSEELSRDPIADVNGGVHENGNNDLGHVSTEIAAEN